MHGPRYLRGIIRDHKEELLSMLRDPSLDLSQKNALRLAVAHELAVI
jgi:hypothetical protein